MVFDLSPNFLIPEISLAEKILRPFLVYVCLVIAFRFLGKRLLGLSTPFDFIVILTIANVLQNAMIGPDNSVLGGLLGAATLIIVDVIFDDLSYRFPWFHRLAEGTPTVLIENGKILAGNLAAERITEEDLARMLRHERVDLDTDLPSLKRVELESDGTITLTRKSSRRAATAEA